MAKSSKIVFKDAVQFNRFLHWAYDHGDLDNSRECQTAYDRFLRLQKSPTTRDDVLDRWLDRNRVEICDHGRKILLATKARNWREYLEMEWSTKNGFREWIHMNISNVPFRIRSFSDWDKQHFSIDRSWPFKGKLNNPPKVKKRPS